MVEDLRVDVNRAYVFRKLTDPEQSALWGEMAQKK